VAGIDFDTSAVDYVRDHLGFPAVCGRLDDAVEHFAPEHFDVIAAFYVLEHVIDVQGTLAICRSLLKPGGWLAAAVPLGDSLQAEVFGRRWGQATEAPRHLSLPSSEGASRALCRAGFEHRSIRLVPDTTIGCAQVAGITLFPQSATSVTYAPGRRRLPWARIAGAAATLAALPWAMADAVLFRRPAMGIMFARKPT
jgi:SAM-dependent methyltransferase